MRNVLSYIKYLNKSPKKEFMISALFGVIPAVVCIVLYFFLFQNLILVIASILTLCLFPLLYLARLPALTTALRRRREEEFAELLSYLRVYLDNGYNTYRAIELLVPLSSFWMQEKLQELILGIDSDKSITPFLEFSKSFSDNLIEQIMVSLFQITFNGYRNSFLENFMRIKRDIRTQTLISERDSFKNGLKNLSILPLLAAGFMTIIITLGILQVVGGMINVL